MYASVSAKGQIILKLWHYVIKLINITFTHYFIHCLGSTSCSIESYTDIHF